MVILVTNFQGFRMKIIFTFFITFGLLMAVELGSIPTKVVLDGDNGGKVDGSAWNSSMLKGKVFVLFYVDPDEKDLNDPFANALQSKEYDRKRFGSVAVINLAATWLPNFAIEAKLKKKQEKFPHTVYVKDKKKILVKEWGMADDNSDILVFEKSGKLIYKKFGKLSDTEIKEVIRLIDRRI